MDLRIPHPTLGLIFGGSGAGKTHFTKRLVEHRHVMFAVNFEEVIWYYAEWQPLYEDLAQNHGVKFIEGLPSMDHFPQNEGPKLVIADDFMDKLSHPDFLSIAIRGGHHRNLTFFALFQSIFPPKLRQISLQAHIVVAMKSARSLDQIRTFCLQISPTGWRGLLEAFLDATKEPHSYLLFDFHQKQKDNLRYRSNIFPGEETSVYVMKRRV